MQQQHLVPNSGPFQQVGLHSLSGKLPSAGLPPPQGLPGLPVALGGTANVTRSNGLHPAHMMLGTPPPLVSVPQSNGMGPLASQSLVASSIRSGITSANSRGPLLPPPTHPAHSVPPSLDTSTHPTQSTPHPTPSTEHIGGTGSTSISSAVTSVPPSSVSGASSHIRQRSPGERHTLGSGDSPPAAKRARSRSPLTVTEESDSDSEPPRSPEPDATVLDKECYRSKNAIFIRHLSRGWNSCSRCDIQFRPTSESNSSRPREEKVKAASQVTSGAQPPTSQPRAPSVAKEAPPREERRERREEEKSLKSDSPNRPNSRSKPQDPQGFLLNSSPYLGHPYGRLSPGMRPPYPGLGVQDPTPALRQLSEYARPHVLSGDPARSLAYSAATGLPAHLMSDPYYRMAAMYPPGSRERLELELDREKRERDARERDMREKELRDLELRKQELPPTMPAGFERLLPPGANPMDPYWTELLKRYAAIPHSGPPPGTSPPGSAPPPGNAPPGATPPVAHHPSQLPGIYPPAHLNNDLMRAERERLERLGEAARAAGGDPLRNANLFYEYYQRISYEQIVLHRQALAQASGSKSPDPGADPRLQEYARLVQHFARADPLSAASAQGQSPQGLPAGYPIPLLHSLPPGHPILEAAARQQEMLYRELFTRSAYGAVTDPVLAQHLSAQQEAVRFALERERLAAHGAGSRPPSHMH